MIINLESGIFISISNSIFLIGLLILKFFGKINILSKSLTLKISNLFWLFSWINVANGFSLILILDIVKQQ